MFTNAKLSLCNSHDTITYWGKSVKRDLKAFIKAFPEHAEFLSHTLEYVNKGLEETRVAKKKGQRMENRLKSYRNSIEKLGFKRV
jgi:Holliday junction resolvasome RuvABC ATP-dependent DNA helicase subunit